MSIRQSVNDKNMNRIDDNLICTGSNEEIVRAFHENDVEFILIGGLAVSWYCSDRQADDMDLLVACTSENATKVSKSFQSLNITGIDINSFSKPGKQASLKGNHYADIITEPKNGWSYSDVAKTSGKAKLFNIPIRIPSIQCLIMLKEYAIEHQEGNVAKHEHDINCLRQQAV